MIILLVDAHGENTAGKCSPDHTFKEWAWSKAFCELLQRKFIKLGLQTNYINPEDRDIPISTSAARANGFALKYGAKNCILISPHVNASPEKGWSNAKGFQVYAHNKASQAACRLAREVNRLAIEAGFKGNRSQPKEGFWRANFGILRETSMPAILTENLYMTSKEDVARLNDSAVVEQLAEVHVKAVLNYINNKWYV